MFEKRSDGNSSNSPSTAEAAAEEHVEEVHRAVEAGAASAASLLDRRLATFVVNRSLLLVRKDFVRHRDLLELFTFVWILKISTIEEKIIRRRRDEWCESTLPCRGGI